MILEFQTFSAANEINAIKQSFQATNSASWNVVGPTVQNVFVSWNETAFYSYLDITREDTFFTDENVTSRISLEIESVFVLGKLYVTRQDYSMSWDRAGLESQSVHSRQLSPLFPEIISSVSEHESSSTILNVDGNGSTRNEYVDGNLISSASFELNYDMNFQISYVTTSFVEFTYGNGTMTLEVYPESVVNIFLQDGGFGQTFNRNTNYLTTTVINVPELISSSTTISTIFVSDSSFTHETTTLHFTSPEEIQGVVLTTVARYDWLNWANYFNIITLGVSKAIHGSIAVYTGGLDSTLGVLSPHFGDFLLTDQITELQFLTTRQSNFVFALPANETFENNRIFQETHTYTRSSLFTRATSLTIISTTFPFVTRTTFNSFFNTLTTTYIHQSYHKTSLSPAGGSFFSVSFAGTNISSVSVVTNSIVTAPNIDNSDSSFEDTHGLTYTALQSFSLSKISALWGVENLDIPYSDVNFYLTIYNPPGGGDVVVTATAANGGATFMGHEYLKRMTALQQSLTSTRVVAPIPNIGYYFNSTASFSRFLPEVTTNFLPTRIVERNKRTMIHENSSTHFGNTTISYLGVSETLSILKTIGDGSLSTFITETLQFDGEPSLPSYLFSSTNPNNLTSYLTLAGGFYIKNKSNGLITSTHYPLSDFSVSSPDSIIYSEASAFYLVNLWQEVSLDAFFGNNFFDFDDHVFTFEISNPNDNSFNTESYRMI